MTAYDALIVGAGPAGATAARLLAAAGWSVALVEKSDFPRRKVCGEFISATSLEVLDDPVLRGAYLASAGPDVRRLALFAGRSRTTAAMPRADASQPWGRALGRERLDLLLRDAAVRAGAVLHQPCKLDALDRQDGQFVARVQGAAGDIDLRARLVISANGSWEKGVLAPPARPHRPSDLLAFKAHFESDSLPDDLMPLLMFPGGYGGMVRTDGGRLSLSCCIRRDVLAQRRQTRGEGSAGAAILAHIQDHCSAVRDALAGAALAGPVLAAGPIRPGIRVESEDGVFRVGNAAGEAHPIIAEGISMAMQSAWLLCRRLVTAGPNPDVHAVAADYALAWRRQFEPRIRAASGLAALAMAPASRRTVAGAVGAAPRLLTWGARVSGKAFALR